MDIKKLFGENLHKYRKIQNMSQEQLAEKLDISVKHLSTLETGKGFASAELMEKISETLNISVSSLFYTSNESVLAERELSKIDLIIEQEMQKAIITAKIRIHEINNK